MNLNKEGILGTMLVFVLMFVILCCVCYCSPVSYRESVVEVTTTQKSYRDQFTFKLQHKTKTPNDSRNADNGDEPHELSFRERNREVENDRYSKVKSVMPGEKTLHQSEDDDDDDDDSDGGEYEGFDYSRDDGSDRKKLQECSKPEASGAGIPMMFIRELDMVAVQIPMKEPLNAQSSKAKEWSEWSPCSRPCRGGKGLQSRWRGQLGIKGNEQQFRPCYLADCGSGDFQFHRSFP